MSSQRGSCPFVSIIILNYNGGSVLERCMESVKLIDYDNFEIILVDNASTDHSLEKVLADFPGKKVKTIYNTANYGYTGGFNIGAREASGKYLAFLNNDVIVTPEWLGPILSAFESDPLVAVCESKIMSSQDMDRIEFGGIYRKSFGFWMTDPPTGETGKIVKLKEIFSAYGVCPVVDADIFRRVGMFDETMFIQHEINDLCWRIRLAGFKVLYVPDSIVFHGARLGNVEHSYGKEISVLSTFHATKNHLYTLFKNMSWASILKLLPFVLFLRSAEIMVFLSSSRTTKAVAKIRALYWDLSNFPHLYSERLWVQRSLRRVDDSQIERHFRRGSLVELFQLSKKLAKQS